MGFEGFADLRTPRDLLQKARRDLARLRKDPLDQDAAFDLFVTARHVPDWMEAQGHGLASAIFDRFVELRICRHLADGAKHFRATHKMHKQVQTIAESSRAFQTNAFQVGAFQTGHLEIDLDPTDQATLSVGPSIDAISLGERVLGVLDRVVP